MLAPPETPLPTRAAAALFAAKATILRARRAAQNLRRPPPKCQKSPATVFAAPAATSRTPLRDDLPPAERPLENGKIQNLRAACRALDGLVLPANQIFSLWRHLGPPTARRGYAPGRMIQQGCVIPSTGGGLCQLSNALYTLALQTNATIIERHAHSRIIPNAPTGRDATIAWNYIDLRFTPTQDFRLTARLGPSHLELALTPRTPLPAPPAITPHQAPRHATPTARTCASCGQTQCFRHTPHQPTAHKAILLDESWPEFLDHIATIRTGADTILAPLNGAAWRLPRYNTTLPLTATAPLATLRRAAALRAASSPPARRHAELIATARLAATLAAKIPPSAETLLLAQSYLPYLLENFHLAARTYDVLMTRLPITALHAALEAAAAHHPSRPTLTDFRAPPHLAALESEALANARHIITPHTAIAALFPGRSILLPWRAPPATTLPQNPIQNRILFPGPTAARKGAFELRAAAQTLNLTITPLGADLEGENFWPAQNLSANRAFAGALAMVQPAVAEEQPRRLLAALAAGLPVIATPACGLPPHPNLTLISPSDTNALITALKKLSNQQPQRPHTNKLDRISNETHTTKQHPELHHAVPNLHAACPHRR